MKAISLPASSAEPPPNATTPSWPPALKAAIAGREIRLDRIGLHVGEQLRRHAAAASVIIAFAVIGIFATTGSVTNSGLRIPPPSRPRRAR
jgi:hypothetical protein